jgi:methyl-accepting chemotaxis protein
MKAVSLSRKFLGRVLLILLIGQAVTLVSVYRDRLHVEEEELTNRAKLLGSIVAGSAYRALLDNDFTYLTLLISDILKDRDISSIVVKDQKGQEYTYNGGTSGQNAPSSSLVLPVTSRDGDVGSVAISYTNKNIRAKLNRHLVLLLVMQASVLLTLALLIRYFFRKDIGGRMTQVVHLLEKVREGDLTVRSASQGKTDEISTIANGCDFLVDHLAGTISKMERIAGNLRDAVDQTKQIMEAVINSAEHQQHNMDTSFQSLVEASGSQQGIIDHATRIQEMARANGDALDIIKGTFEGVVHTIDSLDSEMMTLHSSINELSQSSVEVASLAVQAAESVKNITSTLDSVNASVYKVSKVVEETTHLSSQATESIAGKGIAAVSHSMETIDRIGSIFNSLSDTILRLDDRSKHIIKILLVIHEVTAQANLLSLNAQIIAGQAGEKGKSFSVVADEMKLLAKKTAQSTKEIEGIIQTIQKEIKSAVNETKETALIIQQGNSVAAMTGEVIDEILEMSRRSTEMIQLIAVATEEQNLLIDSVYMDVRQLQDMNLQVKKAAGEQETSTAYVRNAVSSIYASMGETRHKTKEQHHSLKILSGNFQDAHVQIEKITAASSRQQEVNHSVIESITTSLGDGIDMVASVREVSTSISGVHHELERLRQEMSYFRTESGAKVNRLDCAKHTE